MKPSERGGILSWLLIALLVVVCCAVALGLFVARTVHVTTTARDGGGTDVQIDTPGGHLSVHANDNDGWGASDIPRYPGAYSRKKGGGDAVVEWNGTRGKADHDFSVSAQELITSDSVDKVFGFYRDQLPGWTVKKDSTGDKELELKDGNRLRVVGIHERNDGTHIGLASVGGAASN